MNKFVTLALGLLALAAIIFLAIYEPLTRSTREIAAADREGVVMRLDPARVEGIRITTGDNHLEIRRRGNDWQLGKKSKDRADKALVEQVLGVVSGLQFFDRIPGSELNDDQLSDYGLRKPKRKIEFEGGENATLFLGKDAANEDRLYVRTSQSPDVYLVGDDVLRAAFRKPEDFRDKRLTDLTSDQVDRLTVRRQEGEIELLHDATSWQITKPLRARANPQKVGEYLGRILDLRILDYVADDTGDLSAYGLMEGQNEITFFAEGSERHQTLRLGKGNTGELFGQFTARDSVYRLPAETINLLQIKPDDLRDRRLISLNPDIVDLIKIRTPQREFHLVRSGAGWTLKDGDFVRPASEAAVLALWNTLARAEVSSYTPVAGLNLADHGLTPPLLSVQLYSVLSENTPETQAGEQLITGVDFGMTKDGRLFAHLNDSPELAALPTDTLKALPTDAGLWVSPK